MIHIDGEITIGRPVEDVFDTVADERNEPKYNPRFQLVEQVTDGPIGGGTRFKAATTTMGRPAEMTFDPVPAGTRMRWSWELQPHGATRLLTPLIAWMGQRQETEIRSGLKRHLEGTAAASRPELAWTLGGVDEG